MERSSRVIYYEKSKTGFFVIVMFCKQCLAYTVHIDWCNNAIR